MKIFLDDLDSIKRADPLSLSWELLSFILNEPTLFQPDVKGKAKTSILATPSRMYPSLTSSENTSSKPNERKFAESYLKKSYDDEAAIEMRQEFANGAKQWLEA